MFKTNALTRPVWAFDAEWAPDPKAGRLLHKLPAEMPDGDVMEEMWRQAGGTEEDPRPFLKTILCRVLSVSVVARTPNNHGPAGLRLTSLPEKADDPKQCTEENVVGTFLKGIGKRRPVLVGYNSLSADIRIMVQRGVLKGMQSPEFCNRPSKPWEGADYFVKGSEWHLDLQDYITVGWGRGNPSLHQLATLSGIPGKMDMDGLQVAPLWLEGRMDKIVAYNEFDAFTTYLVWLRMAFFAGHMTPEAYEDEQKLVVELLETEAKGGKKHLLDYLAEWKRLKAAIA